MKKITKILAEMLISFSSFIFGFLSMSEIKRKTTIPNKILSLLTAPSGVTALVSEIPGCLPLHSSCYCLNVSAVYYDHLKERETKHYYMIKTKWSKLYYTRGKKH